MMFSIFCSLPGIDYFVWRVRYFDCFSSFLFYILENDNLCSLHTQNQYTLYKCRNVFLGELFVEFFCSFDENYILFSTFATISDFLTFSNLASIFYFLYFFSKSDLISYFLYFFKFSYYFLIFLVFPFLKFENKVYKK